MAAGGNDDVSVALRGLHEHLVHGLDGGEVLRHDALQITAAVTRVAHDAPQDAHVGVRVHKDLHVHALAELGVCENQNALHDNDLRGLDANGLVRAVVHRVVIHRAFDRLAPAQRLKMLHEQIRVEGVGVVIVELRALGVAQIVVALVVIVMIQHAHIISEFLHDALGDGGLAAAGASGNADGDHIHNTRTPFLFCCRTHDTINTPAMQTAFGQKTAAPVRFGAAAAVCAVIRSPAPCRRRRRSSRCFPCAV